MPQTNKVKELQGEDQRDASESCALKDRHKQGNDSKRWIITHALIVGGVKKKKKEDDFKSK